MKNKQLLKYLKYLLLTFLLGVILSCEQEEQQSNISNEVLSDYFFDYQQLKCATESEKSNFTVLSIEQLRAYNEKENFVPSFIDELGYADWDNARFF